MSNARFSPRVMGVVPGRSAEGLWPSLLLSEDGRFGRSIQLADALDDFAAMLQQARVGCKGTGQSSPMKLGRFAGGEC